MKRIALVIFMLMLAASPALASGDMAAKLNAVLLSAPSGGNFQVMAADLDGWIKAGKDDFLVVDVRPNPNEFHLGHIPGAIYISYHEILKPENLNRLPKDKKIVLACVTGQMQNLPVLALRVLGYDAWTLHLGYSSWIKDYFGGDIMRQALAGAQQNKYPLVK